MAFSESIKENNLRSIGFFEGNDGYSNITGTADG